MIAYIEDDARVDLLQVLGRPLFQELADGSGGTAHAHIRHQSQILDQPTRLALGRLRRADHAPLRPATELLITSLHACTFLAMACALPGTRQGR